MTNDETREHRSFSFSFSFSYSFSLRNPEGCIEDEDAPPPSTAGERISSFVIRHSGCVAASGGDFSEEDLRRDAQTAMQGADHADAQRALAVEVFRHSVFSGEILLQVFLPEPLLLHPKLDLLHGVREVDGEVLLLILLHE